MRKILLFLLLTSNAFAREPWRTQDTILQSAVTIIVVVDWMQTYQNVSQNRIYNVTPHGCNIDYYRETNPLLGYKPSKAKINLYMGAEIVIHAGVSYFLPQRYRPIWQACFIGIMGNTVYQNYSIGMRIGF